MTKPSALSMTRLSAKQIGLKPLVAIVGPTAVGKSRVAVELAKRYDTDVITADSRQVYRGMDIGTDKPTQEERQGIVHRLIDLVDPNQPFNAGLFRLRAAEAVEALFATGRLPLIVGGTGLYVRTLVKGLCEAPPADPAVRAELRREASALGPETLYSKLVEVDPQTAAKLHPKDTSKILRALEVHRLSGRPMSSFQREHGFAERPYRTLVIGLDRERHALYRRIEDRIDWQLSHGFIEETERLLAQGYSRDSGALTGLGYRQVSAYLAGQYDRDEMVRRFKRDTRRFAKRQMTWFRGEPEIQWLQLSEQESVHQQADRAAALIERFLHSLEAP